MERVLDAAARDPGADAGDALRMDVLVARNEPYPPNLRYVEGNNVKTVKSVRFTLKPF